jgi:WD40 repeat protein
MFLLQGHKGEIGDHSLTFSPDGRLLASGAHDGKVKVWDLAKRKSKVTLQVADDELVTGVGFIRGGAGLITTDWGGPLRVWDLAAPRKRRRLADYGWMTLNCMAVTADGTKAATAGSITDNDDEYAFWVDLERLLPEATAGSRGGYRIACFKLDQAEGRASILGGHEEEIGYLAFSPDGKLLASGSADCTTRVWDAVTGEQRFKWKQRGWIRGLKFAPDGKTLAAGAGRTVKVWDLTTGEERATLAKGHRETIFTLAYSPDGRFLATGSKDGSVRFWDLTTGRDRAFRWKIGEVHALAFAPDGMTAAAGGEHGDIVVWDVDEV